MCVSQTIHLHLLQFWHRFVVIHPDKTPHARAPEAFDILKKAENELSDKPKRDDLDAIIAQARALLVREMAWPITNTKDIKELEASEEVRTLGGVKAWRDRVRAKTKELLIDEELRRRKWVLHLPIALDMKGPF